MPALAVAMPDVVQGATLVTTDAIHPVQPVLAVLTIAAVARRAVHPVDVVVQDLDDVVYADDWALHALANAVAKVADSFHGFVIA